MKLFSNFSVRWKIGTPLMLIGLIMISMVGLKIITVSSLLEDVHKLSNIYLPSVNYVTQADRDLQQALVAERGMIGVSKYTRQFKEFRETLAENAEQAKERVEEFAAINERPDIQELVSEFWPRYEAWQKTTNHVVALLESGTDDAIISAKNESFGIGARNFSSMREVLDKLQELTLASADEARLHTDLVADNSEKILTVALVIGLLVSVLAIVFGPTLITKPLTKLSEGIRELSAGNLYTRVDIQGKDELARLGDTFNQFAGKQQEAIKHVQESVEQLQESAKGLAAIAEQTNGGANQQKLETEQVASAVTEMASTVQEVAQNAAQTAQSTNQANEEVLSGKSTLEDALGGIKNLATEVEQSAHAIENLKAESANISGVLDVIRTIADQTNLLALNAAIEAARAGTHGRGFSVVADEVRSLAQRTQRSTEEIEGMIKSFETGTIQAVTTMNSGRDQAHQTVGKGEKAGQTLDAVVRTVGDIQDMNHQIASATEQQSLVAEDISQRITSIRQASEETLKGAVETAEASNELLRLGGRLQEIVSGFNVDKAS